jgi:hypothetical protein
MREEQTDFVPYGTFDPAKARSLKAGFEKAGIPVQLLYRGIEIHPDTPVEKGAMYTVMVLRRDFARAGGMAGGFLSGMLSASPELKSTNIKGNKSLSLLVLGVILASFIVPAIANGRYKGLINNLTPLIIFGVLIYSFYSAYKKRH